MNVTLEQNLEERIAERVRRGDYASPEQLITDAVERLLATDEAELEELREKILHAEEQIERGEYTDYDEHTIGELAERVKAARRSRLDAQKHTRAR